MFSEFHIALTGKKIGEVKNREPKEFRRQVNLSGVNQDNL